MNKFHNNIMAKMRGGHSRKNPTRNILKASSSHATKPKAKSMKASTSKGKKLMVSPQGKNLDIYGIQFENDDHKLRFEMLSKSTVVNSQYIDVNYMKSLRF